MLVNRILHYVKGTLSFVLHIGTSPVDTLTAYSVLIGPVVLILGVLLQAIVSILVILWCLGNPSGST